MLTKIKLARIQRDLRQSDVAALTGGIVPQHRLSLLERGVKPRPDEVQALAQAFQVEASELFSNGLKKDPPGATGGRQGLLSND